MDQKESKSSRLQRKKRRQARERVEIFTRKKTWWGKNAKGRQSKQESGEPPRINRKEVGFGERT